MNKVLLSEPSGNLNGLLNQVHNADALTFLRKMPDECVDCVVTSPPYWGLRSYKCDPIVWGGDKDCQHEWGEEIMVPGISGGTNQGNKADNPDGCLYRPVPPSSSSFCLHCSAWLGQLGLEPTIELYIQHLVEIFGECRRVLRKTGSMWINIGDSYAGGGRGGQNPENDTIWSFRGMSQMQKVIGKDLPQKSLCQIPERLSIALTDQLGLIKRNSIIWHKRNCMPSSASDRFTVDFEYLYFFTKSQDYWFEQQFEELALSTTMDPRMNGGFTSNRPERGYVGGNQQGSGLLKPNEQGRNKRCVWDIPTESSPEAHFAVFPRALVYTPVKAGCPPNGVVLDPFAGTGTTCLEAKEQGKNYIGIELSPEYIEIAEKKLRQEVLPFLKEAAVCP